MQKTLRRGLGFAIALLALGALLAPKLLPWRASGDAAPAAPPPPALKVTVHSLVPRSLTERLRTTGTLRADEQVEVTSEVSGKVREILFEEGSRVEAGAVLVKIDDSELQAERARTVHQLELAESREARQRELLASGVLAQEAYDSALAQLNVLRSQLALVEARLLKTEIRAPFAGTLGLRYVSLGTYLSPQTRIASLQSIDPIKIDFSVPEKYAGLLGAGSRILFRVAGSEEDLEGTVYAVEPGIDAETRSLLLRAMSPNPAGKLLPGAFADVEIVMRTIDDALAVPSLAIIPELGGKKVFVVEDGLAQPRQVTTGMRSVEWVEVTSGLRPGDQVIVSGIQSLRPGLEVVAAEEKTAS